MYCKVYFREIQILFLIFDTQDVSMAWGIRQARPITMTRSAVKMAAGTRDYTCKLTRRNYISIVLTRFVYRWWLLSRTNERLPVCQQRCGDDTRPRDIRESSIKITEDGIMYRLNIPSSHAMDTSYYFFFLFWTLIVEFVINLISVLARTCPRLAGEDWPHRREFC